MTLAFIISELKEIKSRHKLHAPGCWVFDEIEDLIIAIERAKEEE